MALKAYVKISTIFSLHVFFKVQIFALNSKLIENCWKEMALVILVGLFSSRTTFFLVILFAFF